MGASTSGFAADIFVHNLETKAISTFADPPDIWKRFVDDTFSILKLSIVDSFLQHLNNQHPNINFTTETETNGQLPFLDVMVHINADRSLRTTVYRKPTHTDQYLDFRSNHHISQKLGIYQTLKNRISTIVTKEEDRHKEENHIQAALINCRHPKWTFKNRQRRATKPDQPTPLAKISIPYVKTISEKIAQAYKRHNISTIHKPSRKLGSILCSSAKDKVHPLDKPNAIYKATCKRHNESYIGETSRPLKVRAHEHGIIPRNQSTRSHSFPPKPSAATRPSRTPAPSRQSTRNRNRIDYHALHTGSNQPLSEKNSAVSQHIAHSHHQQGDVDIKPIAYERNRRSRRFKEALAINTFNPTLNKLFPDPIAITVPAIYSTLPPCFSDISGSRGSPERLIQF